MCHRANPLLVLVAVGAISSGCGRPLKPIQLEPVAGRSQVVIHAGSAFGDLRLWVPEAIASNRGFSAVYPQGNWEQHGEELVQQVGPAGAFGPGNFTIGHDTVACAGIEVPRDEPVAWRTTLRAGRNRVMFTITLRNVGSRSIVAAGAPVCVTFLNAPWWSPDRVYVRSGGRRINLAEMGEEAGKARGFEAYLLDGQRCDNAFYSEYWGFNPHRLDTPIMVSTNDAAGLCVTLSASRAIFMHSNRNNPCTDVMLAFGDLAPGHEATSRGEIGIGRCGPAWTWAVR